MRFENRQEAGRALAKVLEPHLQGPAVVYALPRGGVPVAVEVALHFGLPLDLVIARKIGHPSQPEYAIGAVTETGEPIFGDSGIIATISREWLARNIAEQRQEARRRRELYCGGRARHSAAGKCAVIVDDGIATGLTMLAAVAEIRKDQPAQLIVAVPVAPGETAERFAKLVDRFAAVDIPRRYAGSVGSYYEDFRQVSDQDVQHELTRLLSGKQRSAAEE